MYERKTPQDLECGTIVAMKIFGAKWKFCIIDAINRGYNRPSEIHKEIAEATPRVLDMQLRELDEHNVVFKKVHPGLPLKVEYFLTPLGHSILPIIDMLDKWGNMNRDIVKEKMVSV